MEVPEHAARAAYPNAALGLHQEERPAGRQEEDEDGAAPAKRLNQQADETQDDPAARYVTWAAALSGISLAPAYAGNPSAPHLKKLRNRAGFNAEKARRRCMCSVRRWERLHQTNLTGGRTT